MKHRALFLFVALTLVSAVAFGHHSQVAVYDMSKQVTIEGDLAQVVLRSPHSVVYVMAKDEKGEMQRWTVEWSAGAQLNRAGIDGKTLKAGDRVIITAHPGRDPADHRLLMKTLTRPSDGFAWGKKPDEVVD